MGHCYWIVEEDPNLRLIEKAERKEKKMAETAPAYLGFMLDVSRHYMPVDHILKLIDAARLCGLNTMHWHLTDDQGWRLEIKKYPALTQVGAQRGSSYFGNISETEHNCGFYTQAQVRQVVDYALTEMPPEKIYLGIPNYGYDWPLPFVQGVTRAQSISNQRAIELAVQYDIAIQYDETAQSPFFHYTDDSGTVHEVWFEDARSMEAKLRLIAEYGFQGCGFWNLMRPFSQTWLVLDSLYDIR